MTSNVTVSTSVINNATVTVNGVSWSAQQGQTEVTIDPLLVGEPVGSVLDWKEERQKRRARILAQQADGSSQLEKKQERLDKKQERQEKKKARQLERLEQLDKSNVTLTSNNGQLVTENATVTVSSKPGKEMGVKIQAIITALQPVANQNYQPNQSRPIATLQIAALAKFKADYALN